MSKFNKMKSNYLERIGELEMEVCRKNEEIKTSTKETAISFKKYEVKIESEKNEHEQTRKKMREK